MAAVEFRVQHRNHGGGVISTHVPAGDSLTWNYRASDVGDISYDLALYDDPQLAAGGENSFAPYKTDYHLQMSILGGAWQTIQAGIHTAVNLKNRSGVVEVAGKDWLHWLEQPLFFPKYDVQFAPGDLQDVLDASADDYTGAFFNGTYIKVWIGANGATHQDVIDYLVSNQGKAGPVVTLNPIYGGVGNSFNQVFTYAIMFQDQTNVLDHLKTLAQMNDPLGYDFYVDWDKSLYFFGPRKQVPYSPAPIWT